MQVEKGWNFCPSCGAPLNSDRSMMPGTVDITKMMQQMQQMVGPLIGNMMGGMFQNQPQQRQSHRNPLEKKTEGVEEVIEPDESITDMGNSTVHVIHLPGVKSKADINVIKMENSVEVRASAGRKLYLKIIKREKGESILSEEFSKGSLVIVLRKV